MEAAERSVGAASSGPIRVQDRGQLRVKAAGSTRPGASRVRLQWKTSVPWHRQAVPRDTGAETRARRRAYWMSGDL